VKGKLRHRAGGFRRARRRNSTSWAKPRRRRSSRTRRNKERSVGGAVQRVAQLVVSGEIPGPTVYNYKAEQLKKGAPIDWFSIGRRHRATSFFLFCETGGSAKKRHTARGRFFMIRDQPGGPDRIPAGSDSCPTSTEGDPVSTKIRWMFVDARVSARTNSRVGKGSTPTGSRKASSNGQNRTDSSKKGRSLRPRHPRASTA